MNSFLLLSKFVGICFIRDKKYVKKNSGEKKKNSGEKKKNSGEKMKNSGEKMKNSGEKRIRISIKMKWILKTDGHKKYIIDTNLRLRELVSNIYIIQYCTFVSYLNTSAYID